MDVQDLNIYRKVVPGRAGEYAKYPEELLPEIRDYLYSRGISRLYTHQSEMFLQAIKGHNIVITTSTASGKTLSFLLPVLQELLENPLSRALFIYPTKALAADQYRVLQPYVDAFGEGRLCAGVYDGDTPVTERSRIRKHANIILTNPEMINGAFLPNHSKYGFDFIFSNLKFVIIDELHTYRGAFGSHLANVFRRLDRICRYYHSAPAYFCSSATIANPVELAEEVCGRQFTEISRDGSPAPEKAYILVQPPRIKGKDHRFYGQLHPSAVAAELIPELVEKRRSFLVFAKSRRNVEVIVKEARDRLDGENYMGNALGSQISGYRGGYTAAERKEIENRMIEGGLCGLVSTNALELGIDIGKIDTTVLVGYPGTRASFWQQTGRAGRSGKSCVNYMILDQHPFDQYISVNPDWLFESASESAVIDKNNLLIELAHIRAAAAEIPLTLDDIAVFPDLGETIPVLIRAKELSSGNGRFAWCGSPFPAGDYSLRNIDKIRYKLLNQETGREITEMDEMQAYREIHPGAVYLHDGTQYQVVRMDKETKTSFAVPYSGSYYTVAGGSANIRTIQARKEKTYKRVQASFGDVNVDEMVYMFKKQQYHNHQNLGTEQLSQPLQKDFDTESTWITIPPDVVRTYRSLLQEDRDKHYVRNNHFEGLSFALKSAALMATMTEQEDMGVSVSDQDLLLSEECGSTVQLYVYDQYVGGLGYAEKVYDLLPGIIGHAILMVGGCRCQGGCAACIGDYRLDKNMILWGLKSLLEEQKVPSGIKPPEYGPSTYMTKPFSWKELPEKWSEFTSYLSEEGETYAAFLGSVGEVTVSGKELVLYVNNPFYEEWIMEEINRTGLTNIISFYTDAPVRLSLKVCVKRDETGRDEVNRYETRDKLQKRYGHLKE